MFKTLSFFLIVLILFTLPVLAANPFKVGATLPDFALADIYKDQTVTLKSFTGKIVLMDFWASWCGPCGKSLPKLQALQKKYPNLVVLGINLDQKKPQAQKFLEKLNISFMNLHDSDKKLSETLDIGGMPTLFLIDEKGIIKRRIDGYSHNEINEIDNLLQSQLASNKGTQ